MTLVRVAVPASSANLGPGFDSFGLALDLVDVVEVEVLDPAAGPAQVVVSGYGAGEVPRDDSHLVVRAMCAAYEMLGRPLPTVRVTCRNAIPHGRGLGSSAAAIVSGVVAGATLAEMAGAETLSDADRLDLAARMEGHPDNVAASLLGGFTVSWRSGGRARAVGLTAYPDLTPVVLVPAAVLSTHAARALLPAVVPHADAAANVARAGLLVEAITRQPDLLLEATQDWLHQDYREAGMAPTLALVRTLRGRGVAAAVSGAGPTVIALTTSAQATGVLADAPAGWSAHQLRVAGPTRIEVGHGSDTTGRISGTRN